MALDLIKAITPAALAFFVGILASPLLTHYLYKYKLWKKKAGKVGYAGGETPLFNELHKHKEVGTPRMGGVVIWGSVVITTTLVWLTARLFDVPLLDKLEYVSRSQTWVPFVTLLVGALVGLVDDVLEVTGKGRHFAGGLPLRERLVIVASVALMIAWWFYEKLDVMSVGIPGGGELFLGFFFVPLYVLVALVIYAGGVIDGIDGLAGGVFAIIFSAYAGIAFYQTQYDLAAFCGVLVGGLLAFLWFNIPPARFYMSETGVMGLTMSLTVVAFMTDRLGGGAGVFVLPVIAFPLIATVVSDILQVASKHLRGKKIFKIAPLHHHFEAIGWPAYKVTMRYWVFSVICAFVGVILALAK